MLVGRILTNFANINGLVKFSLGDKKTEVRLSTYYSLILTLLTYVNVSQEIFTKEFC